MVKSKYFLVIACLFIICIDASIFAQTLTPNRQATDRGIPQAKTGAKRLAVPQATAKRPATPQATATSKSTATPQATPQATATPKAIATPQATATPTPQGTFSPEMVTALGALISSLVPLAIIGLICFYGYLVREPLKKLLNNFVAKSETAEEMAFNAGQMGVSLKGAKGANKAEETPLLRETPKDAEAENNEPTQRINEGLDEKDGSISSKDYRNKLNEAADTRNEIELDRVFKEAQKAETDGIEKIRLEAIYWLEKFKLGNSDALDNLKRLINDNESVAIPYVGLALCYFYSGDYVNAMEGLQNALQRESEEDVRASHVKLIATCWQRLGEPEKAYLTIQREIKNFHSDSALFALYAGLAYLYEQGDEAELRVLALEKALEFSPNDTDTLFDLAHTASGLGFNELSILHYKKITDFHPDSPGAHNNLGVAYGNVDMPIYSIKSFQKARELNNTLAASNLANRLLSVGFAEEAQQILKAALEQEKVHENVSGSMQALEAQRRQENTQYEVVIQDANKQQQFLRRYATAIFTPKVEGFTFVGNWTFDDGVEVTITQVKEKIEGNWLESGKKLQIKGTVKNTTAKIELYRMQYSYTDSTKETYFSKQDDGYLFTENGHTLEMMTLQDGKPVFKTLTKKQDSPLPESSE